MIRKVSIIGVGGVGSNLAFNLLSNLEIEQLILLDIKQDQAKAVAYDLEDTRGVLDFSTQIKGTKHYSQIKDSDIVIFSAGVARREGMSRLDLLRINAEIAKKSADNIKRYSPKATIIVVTNPLDIITYLILKQTGFSAKKVIGMGSSLDTSRLLNILAKETGVAASSQQAIVFGPHNKEMVVDFANRQKLETKKIRKAVQFRGAEIVKLFKNKSAVFGPSLVCSELIKAIAYNKNQIIPVSVLLKGEYGLKDVCLGTPCLINKAGADKVIEKKLNKTQEKKLKQIGFALRKTLKKLT